MESNVNIAELELAVVIVDFGLGSKVLKCAKLHGIRHNMVFVGSGTLNNRILTFLRLADIRKEIVLMAADKSTIDAAMDAVSEKFHLDKPFHGIAYTKPLRLLTGPETLSINHRKQEERKDVMYQSLMIIVDRGEAEKVMEIATKAGARGGTVMKARSASDGQDSGSLFGIDIEPEKEVVLILAETAVAAAIADAVHEVYADADSNSVILSQDVNKVYGLK